MTQVDIGTP